MVEYPYQIAVFQFYFRELLIRQDRKHMKKMKPRLLLLHRKNSTQERATLGANVCLEIRNHKSELQHRCHSKFSESTLRFRMFEQRVILL